MTRLLKLPEWHCQPRGTLPVSWHTNSCGLGGLFRGSVTKMNDPTTQSRAQFRAYAFSTGGWTASFQDVPPPRWDLPQSNWTV
jgi:hypothetical protein